jgi:predicted AAA+ superfamily ATPase
MPLLLASLVLISCTRLAHVRTEWPPREDVCPFPTPDQIQRLFDRHTWEVCGDRPDTGTVVNKSDLSDSLDVDNKTVDSWLDILVATYQLVRLPPYFANTPKRVVRRPTCHFADSGLGLVLQGIRDAAGLLAAPHFGRLLESFAILEIRKSDAHAGRLWNAFFWRDSSRRECDLVLLVCQRLVPIEIRHAARLRPRHASGIQAFMRAYGEQAPSGILVSLHPKVDRVSERIWNLPLGLILNGCCSSGADSATPAVPPDAVTR